MTNQEKRFSLLSRIRKMLILLVTLYAMLAMLHWPIGYTFFTQLSNLYAAAIVACQLLLRRRGKTLFLLKYTAAVSITLTFLVFLCVLAPIHPRGILGAYMQDHGSSLCMHLINPILTVWDFLDDARSDCPLTRRHIFLAVLPPLGYFVFILILGRCGLRWAGMTAPYPFLNYAAPAGWFGFRPDTIDRTTLGVGVFYAVLAMLGAVLLIGWLLQFAVHRMKKVPYSE